MQRLSARKAGWLLAPLLAGFLLAGLEALRGPRGLAALLALEAAGHPRLAHGLAEALSRVGSDEDLRVQAAIEAAHLEAAAPGCTDPAAPWEAVLARWPLHPAAAVAWRALAVRPVATPLERAALLGAAASLTGSPEDWAAAGRAWWAAGEPDQARAAWRRAGSPDAAFEAALAELSAGEDVRAHEGLQEVALRVRGDRVVVEGLGLLRRRLSAGALADADGAP